MLKNARSVPAQALVVPSSILPLFHLNLDLWTSKVTSEKFCGLRIFYVDKNFNLCSHVLAVREYNPPSSVRNAKQASDILYIYGDGVLHEVGLSAKKDIASCVTDAGSDCKRWANVLMEDSSWDWCLPHLFNRALAEAFGTASASEPMGATSRGGSTNPEAQELLVKVKKIVSFIHQSPKSRSLLEEIQLEREDFFSVLKVQSDVPQRWKSTINLLERVLVLWTELNMVFVAAQRSSSFPTDADRVTLVELYSLMLPCAAFMTTAQGSNTPGGPVVIIELYRLKSKVLDLDADLMIHDPARDTHGAAIKPVSRSCDELQAVTKSTRKILRAAIISRFFDAYGQTADDLHVSRSFMLDMSAFLYPPMCSMKHVETFLQGSKADQGLTVEQRADKIREETKDRVRSLAIQNYNSIHALRVHTADADGVERRRVPAFSEAQANRRAANASFPADSGSASIDNTAFTSQSLESDAPQTPVLQRKQSAATVLPVHVVPSSRISRDRDYTDLTSILRTGDPGTAGGSSTLRPRLTAEEVIDAELLAFTQFANLDSTTLNSHPPREVLLFWKKQQQTYPNLAQVARTIFGWPVSSAAMERDFGTSGMVITPRRNRLLAAFAEMTMFLKINATLVPTPQNIPKIKPPKLPRRFLPGDEFDVFKRLLDLEKAEAAEAEAARNRTDQESAEDDLSGEHWHESADDLDDNIDVNTV